MSAYLKALGLHVYLATTKKTYFDNDKYIEVNAQALDALKHSLSKEYLSMISHCDSDFAVWNTLTSPELQTTNNVEKEFSGEESDQAWFMIQGNDSLEVISDTHLDDCATSSNNHDGILKMSGYSPSQNKQIRQSIDHQEHKVGVRNMRVRLLVRELELEPFIISHP